MSDRGSVLIVGGGIGGLSASVALRNAGYAVHLVERQDDLRSSVYGVGIIQPANALRALDVIGCARQCVDQGYPASAWMRMYDNDGNLLREMTGDTDHAWIPPMNGITRPKLHRILTDRAVEVGVRIEYSNTVRSLDDHGDGVSVTFADAKEADYDIVVGADGIYSKLRAMVLPPIEPIYVGQSSFRVNIPRLPEVDSIVLQKEDWGTAGMVPLDKDLAYLFLNVNWDQNQRLSDAELYAAVGGFLAKFGGLIGRVRDEHIDEASDIVVRPEEYLIVPRPWHVGRVVFLGDAVHAVTPVLAQGAAQAIEDGIVLADELLKHDVVEEAFEGYVERRFERTKLVVEGCAQIGEWNRRPDPNADDYGLRQRVLAAVAQPI